MTALQIRRVPWDFEGDVPFGWHPTNPEFAVMMNAVSVLAIGFEKYIVAVLRRAERHITDPAVAEECDAFLRQEALHAKAHRLHLKALSRTHPGLEGVVERCLADYDDLYDAKPLAYHLAYIADLEATFTPIFKLFLDHEATLYRPGDERVASLFLWHFVEEVEHRASGLVIFNHVVGKPWYRMRQLPSVFRHVMGTMGTIAEGFNREVPLVERRVDARRVLPVQGTRRRIAERFPRLVPDIDTSTPMAFQGLPPADQRAVLSGLIASQKPHHDPIDQPLPAFADRWMQGWESGADVTRWYRAEALAGAR